jgi:dsRNA-specific ribonuclease
MPNQRIHVRSRTDLEDVLGYKFEKQELLWQALTHKSAITERHPMAFDRDLSSLAFVGDAVLKYAVARYLFLKRTDDEVESCAQLHDGAQKIITNGVLLAIARDKLHLEEYLIRGNGHGTPSNMMYADCMEAIFGAIALDCGSDHQEVIFGVIETLCSQCYENSPIRTGYMPQSYESEDEWITERPIVWPKMQLKSAINTHRSTKSPYQRSCLQTLGRFCLWLFAIFGFIAFCCIAFIIILFIKFHLENNSKSQWTDL